MDYNSSKMEDVLTISRHSILILDDREDVRESVEMFLDSKNITCFKAENVSEAKKILQEHEGEILSAFIDKNLVNEDGLSFVIQFKSDYPDINFAVITAYDLDEKELEIINGNSIDVFVKANFDPELFLRYHGSNRLSVQERTNNFEPEELSNEIFNIKLNLEKSKNDLSKMNIIWEKQAQPVIDQIVALNKTQNLKDEIVIGDESLSTLEIIEEIKNKTDKGIFLVEMHQHVVKDIIEMIKVRSTKTSFVRRFLKIGA